MKTEITDIVSSTDEAVGADDYQTTIDDLQNQNMAFLHENESLQATVVALSEENEALYSTLSDLQTTTATVVQQNEVLIAQVDKVQYTLSVAFCFLVLYSVWFIGKIFYKWLSSFF